MDLTKKRPCTRVHESEKTKSWDILKKRGWGHGAKRNFGFVSNFADPINEINFLKKSKSRRPLEGSNLSFTDEVFLVFHPLPKAPRQV